MQIKTAIALAAAFTAEMVLVPVPAKAVCQQQIYAEESFTDGTNTLILGRSSTAVPFTYQASTTNPVISSLIFAAVAHRNTVFIMGNAQSCPTPPSTVPAAGMALNMGNIIQIFQQP